MPMSTNLNLSKWPDNHLAKDSDNNMLLGVMKLAECKQCWQEVKEVTIRTMQ